MKSKKLKLLTLSIGLLISVNAYCYQELHVGCEDITLDEHTGSQTIEARTKVVFYNDTDHSTLVDYSINLCLVHNDECAQGYWHRQDIPVNHRYIDARGIVLRTSSLHHKGDYPFKIMIDSDGQLGKFHNEKTCVVHVRDNRK